jgi:peptide deformylase
VGRTSTDREHAQVPDGVLQGPDGVPSDSAGADRPQRPELEPDGARDPEFEATSGDEAEATPRETPEEALEEKPGLDPELQARRQAALAHVRQFGDPVLRSRARPVERFDGALGEEVARMGRLMHEAMGVGLAATQVGVLHRVLVYRVQADSPIAGLINPEIEWSGKETETMEEGCLSLPAVHLDVDRPIHVRVSAQDLDGSPLTIEASGFEARVLQHEIDHLDGILILNRVSREDLKEAMRAMREAQEAAAAAA